MQTNAINHCGRRNHYHHLNPTTHLVLVKMHGGTSNAPE
jgi:hypothetical protein